MKFNLSDSVFVLGDSLSAARKTPGGYLGAAIQDWGKNNNVLVFGVGGMALSYFTPSYLKSRSSWAYKAKNQLAEIEHRKPHTVLVFLGTNDYKAKGSVLILAASHLSRLLHGMGVRDVVFVGPPSFDAGLRGGSVMEGISRFYSALSLVPGLQLIDTREISADLTSKSERPDGIHFSHKAASVYGLRLYHLLQKKSSPASTESSILTAAVEATVVTWAAIKIARYLARRFR